MTKWTRGGEKHVLKTYERLHEGKIGAHWIWIAIVRIANGEPELEVMRDYGYFYSRPPDSECDPTDICAGCRCHYSRKQTFEGERK